MSMSATTEKGEHHQEQIKVSCDEVARRAYELWEAAGRSAGKDMEFWLQAEAELLAALRRGRSSEAGDAQASQRAKHPGRSRQPSRERKQ
jgi:hypothetical protein